MGEECVILSLKQWGKRSGRDEATKKNQCSVRLDEQFHRSLAFASHNLGFLI